MKDVPGDPEQSFQAGERFDLLFLCRHELLKPRLRNSNNSHEDSSIQIDEGHIRIAISPSNHMGAKDASGLHRFLHETERPEYKVFVSL